MDYSFPQALKKPKEIHQIQNHRIIPSPEGKWDYYQEWHNVFFAHFKIDKALLEELIPKPLKVVEIDGSAWVSVVSFTMKKLKKRGLFAMPGVSEFHEMNIRTYVESRGMPGVHFLSIEASAKVSSALARKISKLNYQYADMFNGKEGIHHPNGNITYKLGSEMDPKSTVDKGLTELYRVFDVHKGEVKKMEVHHVEWPLMRVQAVKSDLKLPLMANGKEKGVLDLSKADKYHFSPGVQALAWT